LIDAGHVREVRDGDLVRFEATSGADADELGDLIPGGNPAAENG
jgi:hypothetical protein